MPIALDIQKNSLLREVYEQAKGEGKQEGRQEGGIERQEKAENEPG